MANAATWASRVAEWRESGQVAAVFCEGRDFNAKSLLWWSSFLGRKARAKAAPVAFARVVRSGMAGAAPMVDASRGVVVELSGVRVLVRDGAARETVEMVLDVLVGRTR